MKRVFWLFWPLLPARENLTMTTQILPALDQLNPNQITQRGPWACSNRQGGDSRPREPVTNSSLHPWGPVLGQAAQVGLPGQDRSRESEKISSTSPTQCTSWEGRWGRGGKRKSSLTFIPQSEAENICKSCLNEERAAPFHQFFIPWHSFTCTFCHSTEKPASDTFLHFQFRLHSSFTELLVGIKVFPQGIRKID